MKWAVITGACGGLGRAFCQLCAEQNYDLILSGTDEKRLILLKQELLGRYSISIQTYVCDLSKLEDTILFCDYLKQLQIDLLINNAGFGEYCTFEKMSQQTLMDMNQVNMTSMMLVMHAVLPLMKEKGGYVLNVASTAAFQPGPMMANYYATKAYVLSLSEGAALEMKKDKIHICALCCGPVETEFAQKAHIKHTWAQKLMMIEPRHAAKIGLDAVYKGKTRVVAGLFNRCIVCLSHLVPHGLLCSIMNYIQSKRQG